jgi:hypothetical protein
MMMIPYFVQILPISQNDTESVTSLLTWFVGILLAMSGFVIKYLLKQNKERIEDLKSQLEASRIRVTETEWKVQQEIKYNKAQGVANIKMITDIQHVLKDNSKSFSGNNVILRENDVILKATSQRIRDIHRKITE